MRLTSFLYTAVVDAPTGRVTLGANVANGIEQKGIDTLQQCLKKCAAAGLGIPATVRIVYRTNVLQSDYRTVSYMVNGHFTGH